MKIEKKEFEDGMSTEKDFWEDGKTTKTFTVFGRDGKKREIQNHDRSGKLRSTEFFFDGGGSKVVPEPEPLF